MLNNIFNIPTGNHHRGCESVASRFIRRRKVVRIMGACEFEERNTKEKKRKINI